MLLSDLFKRTLENENGCLEWTAGKSKKGYGKLQVGSKHWRAHRLSYHLTNPNTDITQLDICHSCDNPSCINPNHLFAGTRQDNIADMVSKGRQAKGEKIGRAKLTKEEVETIRRFSTLYSQRKLGKMFNVHHKTIGRILCKKTWNI